MATEKIKNKTISFTNHSLHIHSFTHHSFTQHSFTRSQSYTFTVLYITVLHITVLHIYSLQEWPTFSLQDWPTNRIDMGSNDRPTLFKFDDGRWAMEIDGYNNSRKSIRNLFIQCGHHELLIKKLAQTFHSIASLTHALSLGVNLNIWPITLINWRD